MVGGAAETPEGDFAPTRTSTSWGNRVTEPPEVKPRAMQDPVPGEVQPQAPGHTIENSSAEHFLASVTGTALPQQGLPGRDLGEHRGVQPPARWALCHRVCLCGWGSSWVCPSELCDVTTHDLYDTTCVTINTSVSSALALRP